jgi:hypothetical protein
MSAVEFAPPFVGSSVELSNGAVGFGRVLDPEPLVVSGQSWTRWLGPLVSVLILGMVCYQLRTLDIVHLGRLMPASPAFWLAFAAYYLASPASEWLIFRRLWSIPAAGFPALLRKLVSNEILLGYLGEVYFYAWARRHARIRTAPFGAIKDVTILSALMGNVVTLLMVIAAAPLFRSLRLEIDSTTFMLSSTFVLATSLGALLLRNRLFTLPRPELWRIAAVHLGRIFAMAFLAALMWHMLLPVVALSWWLLLGTLRQLLSRLPFLPNKDVVFVGLAAFLVGQETAIVAAMALMAALILAAHLAIGAMLGAAELVRESRMP